MATCLLTVLTRPALGAGLPKLSKLNPEVKTEIKPEVKTAIIGAIPKKVGLGGGLPRDITIGAGANADPRLPGAEYAEVAVSAIGLSAEAARDGFKVDAGAGAGGNVGFNRFHQ